MSKRNSAFRSFLACVVLLAFSGGPWPKALSEPPTATPRSANAFQPRSGDGVAPAPLDVLARATAELSPERISWLEVRVWQRMIDHAGPFECKGRLLRGPSHTVNLRMKVERDKRHSIVECISDGREFARTIRVEGSKANFVNMALPDETLFKDLNILMAHREAFLQSNGCAGPVGMLRTLQAKLGKLRLQEGTWNGKRVYCIEGIAKTVKQPNQKHMESAIAPAYTPRRCRLFVDVKTLWPHRVEWWDDKKVGADVLVLEIEFRDPVINQPAPQHRWAEEFTVPTREETVASR